MNILIIGNFQFPFGTADSSRMRHFALGLTEAGANVRVVCQVPIYDRPEDICPDGSRRYMGIQYESVMNTNYQYKEKLTLYGTFLYYTHFVFGAMKSATRAKEIFESGKIDAIIQLNRSYISLRPFVKLCKQMHVTFIQEITEWPASHLFKLGVLGPFHLDCKLAMYRCITKADGVVAISRFLTDFYAQRGVPTIRIPAIIEIPEEMPEFSGTECENKEFNITYLGGLFAREGPLEMTGAIRKLLLKGLPVRLTIVGSSGVEGTALKFRKVCQADELLRDKVDFLGRVSDEEVVRRLQSADALVFPRINDISSRAAFPTRLPEYLVSGRPVITAGVGDIPEYLRDGIDAMVVSPCNAETIAQRIEDLMKMPDRGKSIGANGFERAREFFNYKTRTKQIFEFIQEVHKNKPKG